MKNSKKTKIHFRGALKEVYGDSIELAVTSPIDAMNAMDSQLPCFRKNMINGAYNINMYVDGKIKYFDNGDDFYNFEGIRDCDLIMTPCITGAGGNNAFTFIAIGVAIVAGAYFLVPKLTAYAGAAGASGAFGATGGAVWSSAAFSIAGATITYGNIALFGVGLILAGVASLLSPIPKVDHRDLQESDDRNSFILSGPKNVADEGVACPIAYGEVFAGSVVVSSGVVTYRGDGNSKQEDIMIMKSGLTREALETYLDSQASGAKGGGKGGGGGAQARTPNIAADTLYSNSRGRFLELISEGPIEGIDEVRPLENIFYDDVPVQNPSPDGVTAGSNNYGGVNIEYANGEPFELITNYPKKFNAVETPHQFQRALTQPNPVIFAVNDDGVDAVRVVVRFNSLSHTEVENGDVSGSSVRLGIHIRSNDKAEFVPAYGTWGKLDSVNISGKASAGFEEDWEIDLAHTAQMSNGGFTNSGDIFFVRVTRYTADSTSVHTQNATQISGYTTIQEYKLAYADRAWVYSELNAEAFGNSVPGRIYKIKGRILRVPNTYFPRGKDGSVDRFYESGIWDGGFHLEWTNNPAWILLDLMENTRYGLGEYIDADAIDKWALYQIARYCDELVPDGTNNPNMVMIEGTNQTIPVDNPLYNDASYKVGREPRFQMDTILNSLQDAKAMLTALAGAFNTIIYEANGTIKFQQDSPHNQEPVKIVNQTNVIDGEFTYQGTSTKEQYSVVSITYHDPNNKMRPIIEVVEDAEMIERIGWIKTDLILIGCTSRRQARAKGYEILDDIKNKTQILRYRASFDHASLEPGDVVEVADPSFAQVRTGGRSRLKPSSYVEADTPTQDNPMPKASMVVVVDALDTKTTKETLMDQPISVNLITGQVLRGTIKGVEMISDAPIPDPDAGETDTIADDIQPNHNYEITIDIITNIEFPEGMTIYDLYVRGALFNIEITDSVKPQQFRIMSIQKNTDAEYEITCVQHDPSKYERLDTGVGDPPDNTDFIFGIEQRGELSPPMNVNRQFAKRSGSATANMLIDCSPSTSPLAGNYVCRVVYPDGNVIIKESPAPTFSFDVLDEGEYLSEVYCTDFLRSARSPSVVNADTLLYTDIIQTINNFRLRQENDNTLTLEWDVVYSPDVFELRRGVSLSESVVVNGRIPGESREYTGLAITNDSFWIRACIGGEYGVYYRVDGSELKLFNEPPFVEIEVGDETTWHSSNRVEIDGDVVKTIPSDTDDSVPYVIQRLELQRPIGSGFIRFDTGDFSDEDAVEMTLASYGDMTLAEIQQDLQSASEIGATSPARASFRYANTAEALETAEWVHVNSPNKISFTGQFIEMRLELRLDTGMKPTIALPTAWEISGDPVEITGENITAGTGGDTTIRYSEYGLTEGSFVAKPNLFVRPDTLQSDESMVITEFEDHFTFSIVDGNGNRVEKIITFRARGIV